MFPSCYQDNKTMNVVGSFVLKTKIFGMSKAEVPCKNCKDPGFRIDKLIKFVWGVLQLCN